jgi:glycosyltransferase involved in cell wall biosynthesis
MSDLPEVLMIAYYFPPMGGDGVQRTLKFVKYLPEFGWRPQVMTVQELDGLQDQSLVEEMPETFAVHRTPYLHLPIGLPWKLRSFISRWFLVVDEQIGWLPFATSAAKKVIAASTDIRVLYSTSTPYTTHLIARRLHHQTHLPWVADFRDPWMGNPFNSFPTAFHKNFNEHLERSVFFEADRVILNTELSKEHYLKKYPTISADKLVSIPNGYDQNDMAYTDHGLQTNPVFTIAHIGSLYRKARSGEFFLTAIHDAIRDGKLNRRKIRLLLIGNIDKRTPVFVHQLNLKDNVDLLGYLPHRQVVNYLYTTDLLLLLPYYGPGGELSIPAKAYEYLASRKPILCLADPGACADLILRTRSGYVVPPTDPIKIADKLSEMYHLWENGELSIDSDMDLISTFERRKLTGQLANLLTEVCA